MNPSADPLSILHEVFGYAEFRGDQGAIVEQVIGGGDALVLMPTGAGKSLCYQVPAIARHRAGQGVAVVVSPLIALMHDQVSALEEVGVHASFLNSTLDGAEASAVERELRSGRLVLLYAAPERILTPRFLAMLDSLHERQLLSLFAIDEAHCVSQWGHDFREEYLGLSVLHERYAGVPRIALTATADAHTRADIIERLSNTLSQARRERCIAAYAEANRTLLRNLLFLGVATLMAAAAAFILTELLIMRQTRSLLQTTEQLASGDLSARTSIPHDQGELGQLAGSFDLMASALEQRKLERDRAEMAMQDYAAELERSNRELQDFANIASHDMQEPLRKILTFSELLQKRYSGVIDERGQDYLDRMDYSAHRLYDLINDLLAYSRVTTRAQPFTVVDLNEIARKVLNDLDLQIEQSGAKVNITSLTTLEADPTQMYQLLQNLVSNALKYHLPGVEPVIQITGLEAAHQTASGGNGVYQIQVSDNGIGFDEKYLDRIFQPFQRLHGRDEFEGTGMGLAICRKIVERHGGSITARSTPGGGTTFIIDLPTNQKSGEVTT